MTPPLRRESDQLPVTARREQWGALSLILLGLLIIVAMIVLHLATAVLDVMGRKDIKVYDPNHGILGVAVALIFIGFFIFSPKRAEEGGGFLSNVLLNIISVVRTGKTSGIVFEREGRRSTDPIRATPIPLPPPAAPTPTPPQPPGSAPNA